MLGFSTAVMIGGFSSRALAADLPIDPCTEANQQKSYSYELGKDKKDKRLYIDEPGRPNGTNGFAIIPETDNNVFVRTTIKTKVTFRDTPVSTMPDYEYEVDPWRYYRVQNGAQIIYKMDEQRTYDIRFKEGKADVTLTCAFPTQGALKPPKLTK